MSKLALVTGAAGFVGRHMTRTLRVRGWDVDAVDVRPGTYFQTDVRDFLAETEVRYDLVVHCAFHVGGRAAIDGEPRLLARNLALDAALFDWAVRTEQPRVVYYSSSAAYPVDLQSAQRTPRRLREDDLTLGLPHAHIGVPDARYGWAKVTGEQLARAAQELGVKVHVLRPFSGYGADQDLTYPFPAIVRRVKQHVPGESFQVWGPPGQTRDWIHIDDVVAATLAIVDAGDTRPINLCTGTGTEFGELVRTGFRVAGRSTDLYGVRYDVAKPTGVFHRVGDPTRMNEHYTAKISLEEGLLRAFE